MNNKSLNTKYSSPAYWTQLIQLSIYDMIKSYLSSHGLTQKEFAEQLGVSKGYVSQILNGDFDHRLSKMVQLGLACGMVPDIEFVPISEASETARRAYLKPQKWEPTGSYSDVVSVKRVNPFDHTSSYSEALRYEGENTEWEENDTNPRIA